MPNKRRLAGEGSIFQRADGYWVASIRVAGQRYTSYGRTKDEALNKLEAIKHQHRLGTLAKPTSVTLSAYLDEWLTTAAPRLKPSTAESYGQLIRHLKPIGHLRLGQVEPRHLAILYSDLQRRGLSAGRVLKLHRVMHKALGDAVRWGLVGRNPAAGVDPPRPEEHQPDLWTLAQMRTFLSNSSVDAHPDARLLAFLLLTGVRLGEALALQWPAVNLDAGSMRVERGLTHVAGKPVEGPPKTRAGVRTLALPPEATTLLRHQHLTQLERQMAAGPAWTGGEKVWTTAKGTAPLRGNVRRSLRLLCGRLELPPIRVHDLRHLHATLLVAGGVDPKAAQRRMGHATLKMTLGVYARALPESDIAAAQAVSTLMQQAERRARAEGPGPAAGS